MLDCGIRVNRTTGVPPIAESICGASAIAGGAIS
jgi:hypothetical protein